MRSRSWPVALAALLVPAIARAQKVEDLDPHVKATASAGSVKLEWQAAPDTTSLSIRKRAMGAAWTTVEASLPASTVSWNDPTVPAGTLVEYDVKRTGTTTGHGYVLAGFEVPFVDPGVVALVVDAETAKLTAVLEDDLAREGWDVEKVVLTTTDGPPEVRAKLVALRATHGERFSTAFLLGRVPRAFSGSINPDGHPDHKGAWPADGYYGDLDGTWSDTQALGGEGTFVNVAGDGKFDPSKLPSDLDVAVGRVDFFDMPAFAPETEQSLLKRYLDADHAFRAGAKTYAPRTFVKDDFGYFSGEAFARLAWRDGFAVYGKGPEVGATFFDPLEDAAGFGLAFGCGGGTPTSASGIGTTADFVKRAPRAAFLGLFGSYFGDWSYRDDLLRAVLASPGGALATTWFARPWHHLHPLAAMKTFGETFVSNANNSGTSWDTGSAARSVHQALLGDPTLRLFVARAPGKAVPTSVAKGVSLAFDPSPDADAGYVIYRREGKAPWARLAEGVASPWIDETAEVGKTYAWRVVARKKQLTGSGSFYLHSPGALLEATRTAVGETDAGAGGDAGAPAAEASSDDPGCGCRTAGRKASPLALLLAFALLRRQRAARS